MPSMLDLGCGLGGASQAMRERGWRVIGVDLERRFRPTVQADVLALPIRGTFDLAWASPPCTAFAANALPFHRSKPSKQSLEAATNLVLGMAHAASNHGRWWLVENVHGAEPFLNPFLGEPRRIGPWRLWGTAPMAQVKRVPPKTEDLAGPAYRGKKVPVKRTRYTRAPHLRAKVPRAISLALAIAIERTLEGKWLT